MKKNTMKAAALAAAAGCLLQFGCLNLGSWWGKALYDGALHTAWDFVLDNDGVYDLWEDGAVVE